MQIKWGFKIAIELTVRQKHCSLMSIHTLSLLLPLAPVAFRLLFFFFFSFVWEIMQDLGLLLFLTSKAMRRVRKLHMDHVHCWGTLLWGCSLPCSLAVTLPLQAPDFPLWWSLCLFHNSLFFSCDCCLTSQKPYFHQRQVLCHSGTKSKHAGVGGRRCREDVIMGKEDAGGSSPPDFVWQLGWDGSSAPEGTPIV